jgi:hypothetical protein
LNEPCEDGLDDLGAAGFEIVTPSDQFVHFLYDFLVNSPLKFSFAMIKKKPKQRIRK